VEAASLAWGALGWEPVFFSEIEPFPAAVLMQKFNATAPLHMPDPDEDGISTKESRKRKANIEAVRRAGKQGKAAGSQESGVRSQNVRATDGGIVTAGKQSDGADKSDESVKKDRVPNLGDMTQINGKEYDGTVELLVGGTPCQGFSIAGKRGGLGDKRSQLSLKYCELAYECGAEWIVWENVPGVFSSEGGKDFARFLGLLCGWAVEVPEDGWRNSGIISGAPGCFSLAWRVLDAQYVRVDGHCRAVPQRRRRVFVVGHLGDWRRAAAVLFDGDSLSGGAPPERKTGEAVAGTLGSRATAGGGLGTEFDLAGGIIQTAGELSEKSETSKKSEKSEQPQKQERARGPAFIADVAGTLTNAGKAAGSATCQDAENGLLLCMSTGQGSAEIGIGTTLNCDHEAPIIVTSEQSGQARKAEDEAIMICASETGPGFWRQDDASGTVKTNMAEPTTVVMEVAETLTANWYKSNGAKAGNNHGIMNAVICFNETQITSPQNRSNPLPGDPCHTLTKDSHAPVICMMKNTEKTDSTDGLTEAMEREMLEDNLFLERGMDKISAEVAHTLRGEGFDASEDGSGRGIPVIAFMAGAGAKAGSTGATADCSPTLKSSESGSNRSPAIAFTPGAGATVGSIAASKELSPTLRAASHGDNRAPAVAVNSTVRRLTPLECERLMGFPDYHTLIRWNGKPASQCPDGPRYKACGNSMPENVMRWIGRRIEMVVRLAAGGKVESEKS
jgi:site-specific DNA-cytosine methylase